MNRLTVLAITLGVMVVQPTLADDAWMSAIVDNGWQRSLTNPSESLVVLTEAAPPNAPYQRLWTRWEYQDLFEGKYLSEQSLLEFDCAAQKFRMVQDIKFSGRNSSGDETPNSTATDWSFAPPGSLFATLASKACGN